MIQPYFNPIRCFESAVLNMRTTMECGVEGDLNQAYRALGEGFSSCVITHLALCKVGLSSTEGRTKRFLAPSVTAWSVLRLVSVIVGM